MQTITSWLKALFAKHPGKEHQSPHTYVIAQKSIDEQKTSKYNEAFYANYFSLIADGARLKLVEAMFSLNLFALFENNTCVLERDIIAKLGLMPIRAQKWLHLLNSEHFLIKITLNNQPAYELPEQFMKRMHSSEWWAMYFFFNNWVNNANKNLADILRFGTTNSSWSWPPKTQEQAALLENWMTRTAKQTIDCILDHFNFKKINSFLDVGGGDGTMACTFATAYPHLKATVYNLPHSAELAKNNIAAKDLSDRVSVFAGNFIQDDAFPLGFDLILFARVLMDWGASTSRKLLRMAYQALPKEGLVAICEIFQDENHDTCLACEYGYIFYDDFDAQVMKSVTDYRRMLEEIGFTIVPTPPSLKEINYYCSLLLAKK